MLYEEDKIRLLESRHDIAAVADPTVLTDRAPWVDAVVASRDELAAARAELVQKAAENARDLGETDTERARLTAALLEAREMYGYVRRRARDFLLDLPPGTRLPAEEMERRQKLYDRYFKKTPTNLNNMAIDSEVEILEAAVGALRSEKDFQNFTYTDMLDDAVRPVSATVEDLTREVKEDKQASRNLQAARDVFDRAHKAHIQQIESLLTRLGRDEEAGQFLKRRNAAYAARRLQKAPIAEEPESDLIDDEVLPTPEPAPAE